MIIFVIDSVSNGSRYIEVVIPAFREARTIRLSLERMIRVFEEAWSAAFKLIVVTDGSDDGTPEEVRAMQSNFIEVIECHSNEGKGSALMVGMRATTAKLVGQLDADLDLHPESLVALVTQLQSEQLDVVVGSKRHADSVVKYPMTRRILSEGYRHLVTLLFGLNVSDTQTGAKVFLGESLRQVLPRVSEKGFVFDLELLRELHREGFRIGEGPVQLDYQFGSSVSPTTVVAMLSETLRVWRKRNP